MTYIQYIAVRLDGWALGVLPDDFIDRSTRAFLNWGALLNWGAFSSP